MSAHSDLAELGHRRHASDSSTHASAMPTKPSPPRHPAKPAQPAGKDNARFTLRAVRQRHDETYHKLFSDRHMMQQLLQDFLPSALLDGWNPDTLESQNTQWTNARLERRASDIIWRLRRRNPASNNAAGPTAKPPPEWIYLYVPLEHQGRPDPRMPLRVLEYAVLTLNGLLDAREIRPEGPYPFLLPIVLYNGKRRWNTPTSLRQYQPDVPEALRQYNPNIAFLLIDINTLDPLRLQSLPNPCAAFFLMERQNTFQGVVDLIPRLDALLSEEHHAALRRTFLSWICEVAILARGGRIDELLLQAQSLSEVHTMLAERVKDWFADARQEGRQEGLQEGEFKGAILLLQSQLEQKFGPLPHWALNRIAQADTEALRQWALNVLQAEQIEDVFGH